MHLTCRLFAILSLTLMSTNFVFSQTDSSSLSLRLYSSAFFDNKEFTGNIKKGYTTHGFFLQPTLNIESAKYSLDAGFHILYLAGADSLEKFVPVLRLTYNILPTFTMTVGTINSKENHFLPEPLFKTERLYLNQPELGVQFKVDRLKYKGDLWINWERYIKTGSPYQEEFAVGFVSQIKPSTFDTKSGIYATAIALATHKGGQIDSTGLPVITLINLGGSVGHRFFIADSDIMAGFEISGYISSDKSPNPQSKYKSGNAIHPKLALIWPSILLEVGYWQSTKFVNPRGEELFGSLSTVNPSFDEDKRKIITSTLAFNKNINKEFFVATGFNAYIDLKNEKTEYSYFFRLVFDGKVLTKP